MNASFIGSYWKNEAFIGKKLEALGEPVIGSGPAQLVG
jgi:hypothetical protein